MPEKPKTPPRLPDGSAFHATYHAAKGEWVGTLSIPAEPERVSFYASARAVFTLLAKLDQRYRSWLKKREG